MYTTPLVKIGNSLGFKISDEIMRDLDLKTGDLLEFISQPDRIVLRKADHALKAKPAIHK